jgi:hypothetical protein
MSENSSGTWKETFCIPICRKSLPVPGIRHFTFLPAIKVWPLEGDLAWLQGPKFSGMGECKRSYSRDWKTLPASAREKKQQQGHYACCNIHNASTPATIDLTTAETLVNAEVHQHGCQQQREGKDLGRHVENMYVYSSRSLRF